MDPITLDGMTFGFLVVISIFLSVIVGYIAFQEGKIKGAKEERKWKGVSVEAQISEGEDGRFGVAVGLQRPTIQFNADWITTGGDRHATRLEAAKLVRKYWPDAYIYDPEKDKTIQRPGETEGQMATVIASMG